MGGARNTNHRSGRGSGRSSKAGLTLAEMLIALAIFAGISTLVVSSLDRESRSLNRYATRTFKDGQVRSMLDRMVGELDFAQGLTPQAWANQAVSAGAVTLEVDTVAQFPSLGMLLIDPGTATEERLTYDDLDVGAPNRFLALGRGAACGGASAHASGTLVRWSGSATAIADQAAPPANFFEGVAQEPSGQVFFRGDGWGFVFQVPVDPAGGDDYFDVDANVRWGARLNNAQIEGGFACFYFEPDGTATEAALGLDVNGDGDQLDSFDRGRIRMRAWDSAAPGNDPVDVALCPPNVLQETCAWGSDLDSDGFQDPMFLWMPDIAKLHIRLLVLTETSAGAPTARLIERSVFLPNGSLN